MISGIDVRGNRRIPVDTIKARIFTRPGDIYDQAAIERDFNSLWNTGYFEDIRFEREQTSKGWLIHIYVKERPTIREITYSGLSSVSNSDVLERFKTLKIGLTPESQYDPTKVKKSRPKDPECAASPVDARRELPFRRHHQRPPFRREPIVTPGAEGYSPTPPARDATTRPACPCRPAG